MALKAGGGSISMADDVRQYQTGVNFQKTSDKIAERFRLRSCAHQKIPYEPEALADFIASNQLLGGESAALRRIG